MQKHLAVFSGDTADKILTGAKKIDIRLSKNNIAPFGQVTTNDQVLMRQSGKKLIGSFIVDRVIFFDHPTKGEIEDIKRKYQKDIGMDDNFWHIKMDAKYLTLIFVRSSTRFLVSPEVNKRDLRSWVVL